MFQKLCKTAEETVTVYIDGVAVPAEPGETVAAVLLRTEPLYANTSIVTESRRAPHCMIGVCFDCRAVVDGVHSIRTCMVQVRDGMRVERQRGKWDGAS